MTLKSDLANSHLSRTIMMPGSFNPFTCGHKSIVDRVLPMCDNLIIAIGVNRDKGLNPDLENRLENIRSIFRDNDKVKVISYTGLTAELARELKVMFIIRGVRGTSDFETEQRLAEVNLRLFGVETLLMPALPELGWISSSTVRELESFGFDTSKLKP